MYKQDSRRKVTFLQYTFILKAVFDLDTIIFVSDFDNIMNFNVFIFILSIRWNNFSMEVVTSKVQVTSEIPTCCVKFCTYAVESGILVAL